MDRALVHLEKKFAHSWASWSVVAGMTEASIQDVINAFDKLEKKAKVFMCDYHREIQFYVHIMDVHDID